jgi:2-hydroxychromene-2-carboxylate isomerase
MPAAASNAASPVIDVYLSTGSPWVYLAAPRLPALAARHGARLVYRPLDAGALFAQTGGVALADRHESRRAYRLQELRRQSAKLSMPLNPQPAFYPVNAAPSAYALIAAQAEGGGDIHALLQALCRAYWAEDRNIADDDVIRDCLAKAGFDPALADRGLLAGAETYGRNLFEAVERGVFGVPFFIVGEERFWGQDRIDDLEAHLSTPTGRS